MVPEEWRAGIGHDFRHYKGKMYRLIVLVAALAMVGCKISEGVEETENRREQTTAMVVAGMKRLNVAEFSGKAGESLVEVVGRLYEISRVGLPGLPEDRNGISLLLRTRSGKSEEPLVAAFSVKDVSFYEAVKAFCEAAGYQFKVDGGYLRIAPAEVELRDLGCPELTEAKLCGHGSVSPEERALLHRMQEMRLSSISFRPPATLKDAVEFFHLASAPVGELEKAIDIRVDADTDAYGKRSIPEIKAFDISLYDAIVLIADSTGFRLEIRGKQVVLKECDGCKLSMVKFGDAEE